ncbi:MAG: hypothetical protein ACI80S_002029 [Pseudohongiellaceae bacterium]
MKKIIKHLAISCFISTVSLASLAVAALGSGTVVFKVGDPIVVNKQGSQNIVKGDELGSGDTILTQSGIVQIQFPDKSFMSLKPKTEFVIDSYNYDQNNDSVQVTKYKLNYGEIRTVSGLIGKTNRKDYSIETPVSTIGIRGTKFRVLVIETTPVNDQPNFKVTLSMGESGAVDVFLPDGVSIPLEAGQVNSLGGVDTLIELIQTDTSVQEVLQTTLADLPATLEKLSSSEGVNQLILDIEEAAEAEAAVAALLAKTAESFFDYATEAAACHRARMCLSSLHWREMLSTEEYREWMSRTNYFKHRPSF